MKYKIFAKIGGMEMDLSGYGKKDTKTHLSLNGFGDNISECLFKLPAPRPFMNLNLKELKEFDVEITVNVKKRK